MEALFNSDFTPQTDLEHEHDRYRDEEDEEAEATSPRVKTSQP